jgi:RND family efflux transporter MFP subunit
MKKIIIIAIILIVVVIVVYRIATKGNKRNVQSISEIQKEKGVPVEVAEVTETELNRTIRFSGTVEGINQSQARADISERIVEFNVEIGDWVTQGQILGKLDPESPQVMVSQAKLAAEDAEREVQRMKSLFEQGAISRQTLEKVELSYNIAAANYKQVLEVVNITAPISGMVTDIFYRVGEIPPPGMPIARIADMSRIRVKMEVSPNFRPDLKPGQKALIYYPDAPQKKIIGTVEKVSYSADAENRNFQAYVTAENPNKYF